ncbi:DUF4326 and YspA-like SLOG domain protein [Myxococcus phage Mx1]|nr:DUF4326 and YspA-like SLOG domain protein [Myxococcus phage Mx1]
MTSLINIHKTKKYDQYIGRAGKGLDGYFGNPCRLEDFSGDRRSCLDAYERYFTQRLANDLEFRTRVDGLRGKTLGCFCWPEQCHGESIIAHLDDPNRVSVVAFTGHRPDKLGGYSRANPTRNGVLASLLGALRAMRPHHAITGMALGVDQWAARCCIHLGIPFTAAIPFAGQERLWPKESQREYWNILGHASSIQVVCGPGIDPVGALQTRNEWMVDRCDRVLAVHDGSKGGTYNCIHFARLVGKRVDVIKP